jgi:carboxyl-terminal processing protease
VFVRGFVAGAAAMFAAIALIPWGEDEGELTREVLNVLEERYWKEVDPESLEQDSARAIVASLREETGDRFSHYFDPEQQAAFDASTHGEFTGIGTTVVEVAAGLRIAVVFPDTPAERAGIEKGDVITRVDGESLRGVPADVASTKIKGPPGTEVELTVRDRSRRAERKIALERAIVRIPAADGRIRMVAAGKVGYVRYATLTAGAHGELRSEVEDLRRRGAEGLVLDLRGNGGGLLDEAVLSASVFIEDGTVVATQGRAEPREVFEAEGDAVPEQPMVVLTDRNTASAAEILAAALADEGLATIVGTRTFGKGTFQQVFELEEGGALSITVGEFVTGSGDSLADRGVIPDVEIADDPEISGDEVLERGLSVLDAELTAR